MRHYLNAAIAIVENQHMVIVRIESPAVGGVPWRKWVGRTADRFIELARLSQHYIESRQGEDIVRHWKCSREKARLILIDKMSAYLSSCKRRKSHSRRQEREIGFDPDHLVLIQRLTKTPQCPAAVLVPGNELSNHRVVMEADLISLLNATVNPDIGTFMRLTQMTQDADGGQKVTCRVLCIDSDLDRVTIYV